ncbi:MAG: HEAT repeat domain-containing protein [Verrucomicrobiota bacterium]
MTSASTEGNAKPKGRRRRFVVAFVVALGVVALVYPRHDPVREKVDKLFDPGRLPATGQIEPAMMEELIDLGPEVIPHLIEKARAPSKLERAYRKLYDALPEKLTRRLPRPADDEVVRGFAVRVIIELGPLAVRQAAPEVIAAVNEPGPVPPEIAMGALAWLLPESDAALQALRHRLQSTNRGPRLPFVGSLGDKVWPELPQLVPELTALLSHPTHGSYAAMALGQVGSNASAAVPALIKVLEQPAILPAPTTPSKVAGIVRRDNRRDRAAYALGNIGFAAPEVINVLAKAWNDADKQVRQYAAHAAGKLGPAMAPVVPQLLAGLSETDNVVLSAKLHAIGKVGPAAREALGKLHELSDQEKLVAQVANTKSSGTSYDVRSLSVAARVAICRIDPQQVPEQLKPIIDDFGVGTPPEVMKFLSELKSDSTYVIGRMETLLADPKCACRPLAGSVILHHNPSHADALRLYEALVESGPLAHRIHPASWLFKFTGRTEHPLALISEGLASSEGQVGQSALTLAGNLGPAARPAIPAIKGALWHKDRYVRENAGLWLRQYAPEELPPIRN